MSADKYPSIFSRQMEAIVYLLGLLLTYATPINFLVSRSPPHVFVISLH